MVVFGRVGQHGRQVRARVGDVDERDACAGGPGLAEGVGGAVVVLLMPNDRGLRSATSYSTATAQQSDTYLSNPRYSRKINQSLTSSGFGPPSVSLKFCM